MRHRGDAYTFSDIPMNSTIDLVTLLERVPNATITVQLSDLNAFARRLIADTREEYEQEISDRLLAIKENYLTADTVKDVLQISETTLWRWAKAGYLLPVMIGGQKRYNVTIIDVTKTSHSMLILKILSSKRRANDKKKKSTD